MNQAAKIAGSVIGVIALVIFVDLLSVMPRYQLEPATVRKVVPDSRGFIGYDEMTLVRFDDGFDDEVAGNRGEPGDKILAPRRRGVQTMFGILPRLWSDE